MRGVALGMVAGAVLSAAAVIGLQAFTPAAKAVDSNTYRELNLFGDVFERIRADYVDPVKSKKLIGAAINGMLTSLDPHSSYMDAATYKDMQVQTRGEFGGLGIEVTMKDGLVKVVSPIDDTPASRAGLKPGDLITHINGEPVLGKTLNDAVDLMRGPVNSSITVTVVRSGHKAFDVTMKRAIIHVKSVKDALKGKNIGYIRITSFTEQTDSGLQKAVADIRAKASKKKVKIDGYILDLRNNPGGLLDQAISVCDDFLDHGEIVSTRGRHADDVQRYNARPGDLFGDKPVVVLINGGSASASEIVAGALQDHKRATIMGTRSFGKGSVQTIIPLAGGADGAMRLTTARYYTPSGRSIQATGIEPNIVVEQPDVSAELQEGNGESRLPHHLPNPNAPKTKKAPGSVNAAPTTDNGGQAKNEAPPKDQEQLDKDTKATGKNAPDVQLEAAIKFLHDGGKQVSQHAQR